MPLNRCWERIVWSDTPGVRQVVKVKPINNPLSLLTAAYQPDADKRRAA